MAAAQPDRLESIDALRGIAFLGVLFVHTGQGVPAFFGKELTTLGSFGVSLFFIASAYTLLASHHQRRGREPSPALAFFIRRIFRIVPLFWAGIFFYYFIYGTWNRGWAEDPLGWFHYGLTALLLHGWHPDTVNSVVPGGWSIAAEFGFYVLAPLSFAVVVNWRRALLAYAAAVILALASSALLLETQLLDRLFPAVAAWRQDSFVFLWLPFHLPSFMLGFAGYYLLAGYRTLAPSLKRLCLIAVCAALAASAIGLPLRVNDYVLPVLLAVFVIALIADPIRVFVNRGTCALGVVSFSAYITHFGALKVIEKLATRLPQVAPEIHFLFLFIGTLALTVAISWVTYRIIEQPGIALGRKLLQELRRRSELPLITHVQTSRISR